MLALRELERGDLPEIKAWRQDGALVRCLGAPFRYINSETEERWFDDYMAQRGDTVRCAIVDQERPGQILGLCSLRDIDWIRRAGELHILIGRAENRRRGLGTFAVSHLLSHAFADMNLNRVQLGVLADNAPAIGLYRKLGFRTEGRLREYAYKDGRYMDMLLMSLLRREWRGGKDEGPCDPF